MTLSNDKQLSFGRYLQTCREMKKLSLESIADNLKVGRSVLKAIENEDLSRMPDEVFSKGFLRGYARIVNADEHRVIHDYLQRLRQFNLSIQSSQDLIRENDLFWRKLIVSLAVVSLVIVLTVVFLSRPEEQGLETKAPMVNNNVTVNTDVKMKPSTQTTPETTRLSIITVEDTWLKIIIDNEKTREYTLRPGDRLDFEASLGYNLLIGNAAGIKVFANRIPVDLPEEQGKVVNIEIP